MRKRGDRRRRGEEEGVEEQNEWERRRVSGLRREVEKERFQNEEEGEEKEDGKEGKNRMGRRRERSKRDGEWRN